METWQTIAIFVAVFGVIIGNLMLLRHSAKMDFKVPKSKAKEDKKSPDV